MRLLALPLMPLLLLTACGGAGGSPIPGPSPAATASPAPALQNVAIPAGAYLGAVDNVQQNNQQEQQLESLEAQAGKRFAMQLTYATWANLTPAYVASNAELQGDITYHRIPNLSWTCGDDLHNIAQASPSSTGQMLADYQTIKTAADALKGYGHPVLLRFFHEFNLDVGGQTTNGDAANCFDPNDTMSVRAQKFVAAWENIYAIFQGEGATNVSFEWCPVDVGGAIPDYATLQQFLPQHVDWIGLDKYDRASVGFKAMVSGFYGHFASYNKPIVISETGEIPSGNPSNLPNWNPSWTQSQFFSDIESALPATYPMIKGINYFDSSGAVMWFLDAGGTAGITSALHDPYFVSPP